MKKILLSAALLTAAATSAHAQSPSFGIKAGASLTNAVGGTNSGGSFENKFGFHGGFVANFPLSDLLSIQPELLYSMKGFKFSSPNPFDGVLVRSTHTLHYIDVPVLARLTTGSLFFEAGPQFGYLVAAKFEREGSTNFPASSNTSRNDYQKVDFGYAAGLGYQLPGGAGIGLRYNGGFKNFTKFYNNEGIRNSAFQLYLSYMLGGK